MQGHPFTESTFKKLVGAALFTVAVCIQWGMLTIYTAAPQTPALVDSILTIGLLSVAGYLSWFIISFIRVWQAQVALALVVQLVCLGTGFLLLALFGVDDTDIFIEGLPLRLLFGILSWTILIQWYKKQLSVGEDKESELPEKILIDEPTVELVDRISVKDGTRIHIVHLNELYCLQASGDYVTLCTEKGQYIKEQTMKYFETHLPPAFVRIHRSSIINTEHILRVELFGKETYQVRLKNGQSLRASNTGYKLLKERLDL